MINILCDSKFRESVWCKSITTGILEGFKKKRRKYRFISESDIEKLSQDEGVFVVGSNDKWINSKVEMCNSAKLVPIVVCNQRGRVCKGNYHGVSVDIDDVMEQICSYLKLHGCKKGVFYGLNEASASDRGKAECFKACFGSSVAVIENKGSLDGAYSQLMEIVDETDAVVCANDFFAVHLVKRLLSERADILTKLKIVSSVKTKLSSLYEKYIVSLETDFELIGKTAADLYEFIVDKPYLSGISVYVKCKKLYDEGAQALVSIREAYFDNDNFYSDEEIVEALKVDNLMSTCKSEDFEILKLICSGKTYLQIADECFMSESNVKYRVKKYLEALGLKNREELRLLVSEYII